MEGNQVEIVSAIIGGFLAAGTGWLLQHRLESGRLKRTKQLLLLGITDDLANSIELYDRITEDWEKSKIVWFNLLNELSESRHVYTNNKDWITLIEDEQLRKDILQYYRKSANHLLLLQNSQQRKYDIQGRYNSLVQEFRLQHPQVELDAAQKQVATNMSIESEELASLDKQLPELVSGLSRFRSNAKSMLESLKSE